MNKHRHIQSLLDRVARLNAAEAWADDLNPSQTAALAYLGQANRFSRAPSHVADYLASTRGTVSQTLKALLRKGAVREVRSDADRRSIRYDVTGAGLALGQAERQIDAALHALSRQDLDALDSALSDMLRRMLTARGGRSFGICRSCTHHEARAQGGYCHLLDVKLDPQEADQICHEHEPVAGGGPQPTMPTIS